jgi:hypothetical protein
MIKRLKLGLHILLLLSGIIQLHAEVTPQECAQYDDFDEFLGVDEDNVVTLKIQRIKDIDALILILEQRENESPDEYEDPDEIESPEFVQRCRALREDLQVYRAELYQDLVRLKAALATMRVRQENVSSEIES